ncbi:MAG: UDP-N-acetylmuramate--L-alanine ligase [Parcubacteria group bacterium CG10_big_fil_rev_8_21_14_0_10_38_31]|nr:MAG: UDP-N-acetylmuramate--L-alanine ligase [Parcubacteria group bacterium CG10_big_fil_rev_8_21_14_0_10_38_31]
MKVDLLNNIKGVHFIGIGGIGVSAIARMMKREGKIVSGSDLHDSAILTDLRKSGMDIKIGHKNANLPDNADLVVYTTAISEDNPEIKKAKKMEIDIISYPEMLGVVSREKYTIAVSGTHGKTTTTAMVAKILGDAKINPTVVVGSILKEGGSNFIFGKSKPVRLNNTIYSGGYFLTEACEYKRAFLNLSPKIIIITNIDKDHLDYYKNIKDIQSAFISFVKKLDKDGYLVCDTLGENMKPIISMAKKVGCKIIDYSKISVKLKLKVPGEYNVKNAKASLALAQILRVKKPLAVKALNNFKGTWRRFEYKGSVNGVLVYDDYAHHPTEIQATLKGARDYFKKKKVWAVFQPHLYSRTKLLLDEFAKSFNNADEVVIADIYAAREKEDKTIHAKNLVGKIEKQNKNVQYIHSLDKIKDFLLKNTKKGDVVITIGAGDIFKVGEALFK